MLKVNFYALDTVADSKLQFAVILAKHEQKWIWVRHKERKTWEVPGGHREPGEPIEAAARRELYEESGATQFLLTPLCIYSVQRESGETFGQLFYAEVETLGELPESEIGEVRLFESMPDALTYPLIQSRFMQWLNQRP